MPCKRCKVALERNERLEKLLQSVLEELGLEGPEYDETPRRIADALMLCTRGLCEDPRKYLERTLPTEHKEMVVIRPIGFFCVCPHHLWPYYGEVSIAYIPSGKIAGLSKFHSLVECITGKPMLQEELTSEIADIIDEMLKPVGVMVVVEAKHTCMYARGRYDYSVMTPVEERTVTSALRGVFLTAETPRMEALRLMGK